MPRKAICGQNDVKTLYPKLMLDWDYEKNKIDPSTVLPGSGIRISWKCHKCGYCTYYLWDLLADKGKMIDKFDISGCGCCK